MGNHFFLARSLSLVLICISFQTATVKAQFTSPLFQGDNAARSMQLMGKYDSSVSFTARSFSLQTGEQASSIYAFLMGNDKGSFEKKIFSGQHPKINLYGLPFVMTHQFNSHHPYGWNDGAMISSQGYQTYASIGVGGSFGPVEIQLRPEAVFATNGGYESVKNEYGTATGKVYAKLFPGQSTISISSGKFSLGVSSANLWWGPGIRSSLLMSTNAPGIPHMFFRSRKPVNIGIGSLEWQLIGGWLSSNDSLGFENNNLIPKDPAQVSHNRYLNAMAVSYQPKWVPGLFVGLTRSVQTYVKDNLQASIGGFERYLPVIALSVQKKDVRNEDSLNRDQLASFFLRWVFPKTHFEVYFEYGFNDYGANIRDYLMSPSHGAAYTAGFQKVIPQALNKRIEFGVELTQMSQSPDWIVRQAGNWYRHLQVWEGYTFQNQIIGAGAGIGCDVISINAAWIDGWKQLGFVLERVNRDPQPHTTKWIDLGLGILPRCKYKDFYISGIFELIKNKNYGWQNGVNRINVHTQLSLQYNF